jgi:hypothetical protein
METPRDRDDRLAEDLRALRPTPHPQFATELDKRAAAGFPRRSRLRWPSFNRLRAIPRRRLLLPAGGLALIAIAVSTALVATGNDDEKVRPGGSFLSLGPSEVEESAPSSPPPVQTSAGEADSAASGAVGSSNAPPSYDGNGRYSGEQDADTLLRNRAVERSAKIVLGADPADVADDSAQVFEVVHAHNGVVMRSSTDQGTIGEAGARFELLIPSSRLSDALAGLSEIGEVRSREEDTDDITFPTVNVAELLQDSKARIDSLLAQLAESETESEREAVEAELRQERRHRASLRSDLQRLQRRADLSRVLVRIETDAAENPFSDGAWGVNDALEDAGKILGVAAAIAVVALAILGPIALIVLLAWLAHRTWVRRERRRVLS